MLIVEIMVAMVVVVLMVIIVVIIIEVGVVIIVIMMAIASPIALLFSQVSPRIHGSSRRHRPAPQAWLTAWESALTVDLSLAVLILRIVSPSRP